ncbi:spore germination protein [Oceanobacillus halophilus]|uniref:spore germination protein n=1 Tax=Oceanobacillus halophilus TaxID=930130 RepID=UPI0013145F67|nr:spore germination protein [Oceanobacillus halophilus]
MKRDSKLKSILSSATKKLKDQDNHTSETLSNDIQKNKEKLKKQFGPSEDVIFRQLNIPFDDDTAQDTLLVFVDGMVDENAVRNNIINALITQPLKLQRGGDKLEKVKSKVSIFNTVTNETDIEKAVFEILQGSAFLLVEGYDQGLLMNVAGFELRSPEEPETERMVRGARDGFIESISTNMALLRRRIPHTSLQFETIKIGKYSQTQIAIAYVKDITDPKLVERIKLRLHQINVDAIENSGEIEQSIEDHPFSIFPTIGNTGRPDKASALLMEGRVILIVDGDPCILYAPYLCLESIQSLEDYTSRPYYTSFIRIIRFVSFLISILFPALYIAVLNFHKVMIPSEMVVPLIQARETVPFPLAMEIIIIILMFETVREAGIRLPQQVGSALSIVGALIFGQVAVSAGIMGAPTTVVVSISYIASFINSSISGVISLLRIGLFIAASLFGGYGLIMAMLGLLTHMVSLTSIGIPYMAPFAPFYFRDWNDTLIRFPYRWLKQRPKSIPNKRPKKIESLPKTGDK